MTRVLPRRATRSISPAFERTLRSTMRVAAQAIEPRGAPFAASSELARIDAMSAAMEVPLDVEVLDVDDDRAAVGAGERDSTSCEQLGDEARHLLAAERAVHFDRRLAGERGARFSRARASTCDALLLERGVDQLAQERRRRRCARAPAGRRRWRRRCRRSARCRSRRRAARRACDSSTALSAAPRS